MSRKHLDARRARARQLAEAEGKARCSWCKRALSETPQVWESFFVAGRFCSEDCMRSAQEADR